MGNRPMSILLIEDDVYECENFKAFVNENNEVELIGVTNSSDEGLEIFKTYTPEAVVLDIELHEGQGSGLEFIENMKNLITDFRPIIVITTNACSKLLYNKLHEEGADLIFYKHQKDYSPKLVVSTLLSLRKTLYKYNETDKNTKKFIETAVEHEEKIANKVNNELDLIGISSHLKGREYLYNAITYLIKQQGKELNESPFNYLANKYKRSSSSISRVMQTAINYAWRTSAPEDLETYYKANVNYNTGVPSPTEFIYYYKQKISQML